MNIHAIPGAFQPQRPPHLSDKARLELALHMLEIIHYGMQEAHIFGRTYEVEADTLGSIGEVLYLCGRRPNP